MPQTLRLSLGDVNSYQRTQMNLRGWSCWMLPSQPVFTATPGYSRTAKVRSQQLIPGGASIFRSSPKMCFTFDGCTRDYFMSCLAPIPPPVLLNPWILPHRSLCASAWSSRCRRRPWVLQPEDLKIG